jgi:RNA 2',3'-cyclic 3'-phosphodiesterase
MHRLFVALRPPRLMRETLLQAMEMDQMLRWQSDEQLHLTLRFIGEIETPVAEDVAAALDTVDGPRPRIAIDGVGTFGERARVRSLWARVVSDPALTLLHGRIDAALLRVGIAPDRRAFTPHITLARTTQGAVASPQTMQRLTQLHHPPIVADHFLLLESRLSRAGADYMVVARYPLRKA